MKVKCINNHEKLTLTINSTYIVYGGEFSLNNIGKKYEKFIIENNNGSLVPYNASGFDIIFDINDDYIITNTTDNKFKFVYKEISYDEFWSMFYDDNNTAINDFNVAKKELYIKELNEDEIKAKLTSNNIVERDFMADVLVTCKNDSYIKYVIDFCNNELNKWTRNASFELELLFRYLSSFKNSSTDKFFNNYLLESEKGDEILDNITYEFFAKNS